MSQVLRATAGAAAGVALLFVGVLNAPWLHAQSQSTPPPSSPAFEVASVKPSKSGGPLGMRNMSGDRVAITNTSLRTLIQAAYGIQAPLLIGGPTWIGSERFDVNAKAQAPASLSQLQLMLRALLAERFKLVVHTESRPLPVYALVMARLDGKLGPDLRRSEIDCAPLLAAAAIGQALAPPAPGKPSPCVIQSSWPLFASAITMVQLADWLSPWVTREVVDRTGLTGNFDVGLMWTVELPSEPTGVRPPAEPPRLNGVVVDPNGPSIFAALQEQLGLKLDSQRGPVDVLVIDHVEHPSED